MSLERWSPDNKPESTSTGAHERCLKARGLFISSSLVNLVVQANMLERSWSRSPKENIFEARDEISSKNQSKRYADRKMLLPVSFNESAFQTIDLKVILGLSSVEKANFSYGKSNVRLMLSKAQRQYRKVLDYAIYL